MKLTDIILNGATATGVLGAICTIYAAWIAAPVIIYLFMIIIGFVIVSGIIITLIRDGIHEV